MYTTIRNSIDYKNKKKFSKYALNLSNVIVKPFIMLQNISIQSKSSAYYNDF